MKTQTDTDPVKSQGVRCSRIQFFVPGEAKGQPRPRAFARPMGGGKFSARIYDAGTAEGWKGQIALAAKPHLPATPISGPVSVRVVFNLPRPKAHFRSNGELKNGSPFWHTKKCDLDNFCKAVFDALTQIGMWVDDCQVCELTTKKTYAANPGAAIEVMELATQ